MILGIALLIFLVGCIVSSVDDASASAQRREEQRQKELMKLLSENRNTFTFHFSIYQCKIETKIPVKEEKQQMEKVE